MNGSGINAKSLLNREVVALRDGSYFGKVQSIGINTGTKMVTGLFIKPKGILSGKVFIPFSGIQSFGDYGVTIKEDFDIDNPIKTMEEKELLEMPVITVNGNLLGFVDNFTFDKTDGTIVEYILSEGLVRDTFRGKGVLPGSKVSRIGKDVIIAVEAVESLNFEEVSEDVESFPSIIEDPIIKIDVEGPEIETEVQEDDDREEKERAIEKEWHRALQKVKIVSERLTEKIKVQANKVGDEAREFFADAQNVTQKQLERLNRVIENWQGKLAVIQNKEDDKFNQQLLDEIKNKTVGCPLYDDEGNSIILPGQVIDSGVVKKAMEKGKLHQLFILVAAKDVEEQVEKVEEIEQLQKY